MFERRPDPFRTTLRARINLFGDESLFHEIQVVRTGNTTDTLRFKAGLDEPYDGVFLAYGFAAHLLPNHRSSEVHFLGLQIDT